jgi:glycosyltransferase involved in cell wall biosynthesis
MPAGSGAIIVHQALASSLSGYRLCPYPSRMEYFPFLMGLCCREHAEVVHTTPDHGIFFAGKGRSLILTFHNYYLDSFMQAYSTPFQRLHYRTDLRLFTRLSLARAEVVTAVSEFTARRMAKDMRYGGPVRVIRNGVDVEFFRPSGSKRTGRDIKVLFCGNRTKRKGFHYLKDIANLLDKNITLYCIGPRKSRRNVTHPGIKMMPPVPHQQMPALYASMDLLLLPSVREGLSLAVLEAMACGLPVVATRASSMPEVITDQEGGFLCGVGEVEAFAEKINLLAEDSSLRRRMGSFNRYRVETEFRLESMIQSYRNLFEQLL